MVQVAAHCSKEVKVADTAAVGHIDPQARVWISSTEGMLASPMLPLSLNPGPAHEIMQAILKAVLPTAINPIKKSPTGMPIDCHDLNIPH